MVSTLPLIGHGDERANAIAALTVDLVASYQGSELSLLSAASATTEGPLFYLRTRDRSLELLGIGSVASFRSDSLERFRATFDWLVPALRNHAQRDYLFLLGGTSFDGEMPGSRWEEFGAVHFMIPRCLYLRKANTVNVFLVSEHEAPRMGRFPASDPNCTVSWRSAVPTPAAWDEVVGEALHQIANGSLEKVVLARRADAKIDKPVNPATLLRRLLSSPQRVSGFAFAPGTSIDQCFFGATPELLFALDNATLVSEAVAGTLHPSAIQKDPLSGDISSKSASQKERIEHECVVTAIVDRLQTVSVQVDAEPEPTISPLHDLYHLVTPIRARLETALTPFDLIALLHPTPAVCGSPSESAREFIRNQEPFERGWYAGTIGYINGYRAEFSVSLRSALLDGQKLSAYVGAGIVCGSNPTNEWEELNLKQRRMEESLASAPLERPETVRP